MNPSRARSLAQYCAMAATPCAMADIHYVELNNVLNYNDPTASFNIMAGMFGEMSVGFNSKATNQTSSFYGDDWAWGYWIRNNRAISMTVQPGGYMFGTEMRLGLDGVSTIRRFNAGEQIGGSMSLGLQGNFAGRTTSWGERGVRYVNNGTYYSTWVESSHWTGSDMTGLGQFYIGFEFDTGLFEETFYGWIDFEVSMDNLIVHGYAYDTTGAGIEAGYVPAPGALGLIALAAGAGGIRRKRAG